MPRKDDFISMKYRFQVVERSHSKREVFQAMMRTVQFSEPLPAWLRVTWGWQNSPSQDMRFDSLEKVVLPPEADGSRAGFLHLMMRRLTRDAVRAVPDFVVPSVREATEAEQETIERALEESEGERAEKKPGEGTRARAEFLRRSRAAKKGWITCRRHMREKAQAAERRKKARKKAGRKR